MRPNSIPRGVRSPLFASLFAPPPRALLGAGPYANAADPARVVADLKAAFGDFKDKHVGRVDRLEASVGDFQNAIDQIAVRAASGALGGGLIAGVGPAPDPEYSSSFMAYARGGTGFQELVASNREGDRGRINAAMSVAPGESGGVLAPTEWDRRISKSQRDRSPLRQICSVQTTSVNAYSTVWNMGGFGSGWVGETASRPGTTTPELRPLTFTHGELYAFPFVTQKLIDDADFNLEEWLADEVADEFDKQESITFIAGDGVNKPQGLLTYATGGSAAAVHPGGAITIAPTGAASALGNSDTLVDFVYSLPGSYRQNARWLMNSATAAIIAKMKDGQGNYLWRETYVAGQPPTLLGYAVAIDENMPNVGAGNIPIAFGDFKAGYVINDRFGIRVLRDPFTNKPYVGFYTTKRVGGGLLDPKAIRFMKVAVS